MIMKKNRAFARAFTLVELLVTITIVSILTSICVLGLKSLTGSAGLTGAGDQVSALLSFARQEAIAKDTMTAVVLVTTPNAGKAAYRTFSLWELKVRTDGTPPSSSDWVQASKWQTLPVGTVVDSSNTASTFLASSTPTPSLPTLNYVGTNLNPASDCAVQIFLPSGRLVSSSGNPYILQLVEGYYNGTTTTYQHVNASNTALPANYVQYVFSTATGVPKIVRP
jgi:prepilin-type N-terminal cleavage/methylation domain-containing protein